MTPGAIRTPRRQRPLLLRDHCNSPGLSRSLLVVKAEDLVGKVNSLSACVA